MYEKVKFIYFIYLFKELLNSIIFRIVHRFQFFIRLSINFEENSLFLYVSLRFISRIYFYRIFRTIAFRDQLSTLD